MGLNMPDVVLFGFYGRTPNMRLQQPFIRRILSEHPEIRWDIWNLARDQIDAIYLQSLGGQRVLIRNDFWRSRAYDAVYRYYAQPEYKDCLFVKIDDDIVFIQSARFGEFVEAIASNPSHIVSAMTVNNGASARVEPGLWRGYKTLGIPLLEVHTDVRFADMCHNYFFTNWRKMLAAPTKLVDTKDWVSINMVGFDHTALCEMVSGLNGPSPELIAGRVFDPRINRLGDEGAANLLPRKILKGFTACHLGFGPQRPSIEQFDDWRRQYAPICAEYLHGGSGEKVA